MQLLLALDRRQPYFASEAIWKACPWDQTFSKTTHDQLLDMISAVHSLCHEAQRLRWHYSDDRMDRVHELRSSVSQLDIEMEDFHQRYKKSVSTSLLFWPVGDKSSILEGLDHKQLFPVVYEFADLDVATTLMLYWATLAMLWNAMSYLDELTNSRNSLHTRDDLFSVAQNVCQSVDYCFHDEMGDTGPTNAIVPLRMVAEVFRSMEGTEQELRWVHQVLGKVSRLDGARVLRFDPEYASYRLA